MFPYLLNHNTKLHSDDIAGIQALYGRPKIDPNKPTTPTPPSGKKLQNKLISDCSNI